MAVLLTGSSGLLGTALTPLLSAAGHAVVPLRRRSSVPGPGEAVWDAEAGKIDLTQAGPLNAVVHLAGESVGQRWSTASKRRMWDSRCRGTELLCAALNQMPEPPHTLVCASATGFYGDRGEEWLEERSAAGTGFLAELTTAWEKASAQAIARGIRVVHMRLGIVLAPQGGALARMLPIFRAGLGGRLGNGCQYWSWVSLEDCLRAILHVLTDRSLDGPVNVTSPCPVTNAVFTRALGQALHRPAVLATPRFLVELAFGEMGREALLASARVRPARLLGAGFAFRQSELGEALRESLNVGR